LGETPKFCLHKEKPTELILKSSLNKKKYILAVFFCEKFFVYKYFNYYCHSKAPKKAKSRFLQVLFLIPMNMTP
jgi:hypothetical protein